MEGGPYISVLKKQFGTGDYRKAPTAELIIFIVTRSFSDSHLLDIQTPFSCMIIFYTFYSIFRLPFNLFPNRPFHFTKRITHRCALSDLPYKKTPLASTMYGLKLY